MVGSPRSSLTAALASLRQDLLAIARAAVDRASASRLVTRTLTHAPLRDQLAATPLWVVAAGKAARPMATALLDTPGLRVRYTLAVDSRPGRRVDRPQGIERIEAGHPLPDARSVEAARRALKLASRAEPGEQLVLLLSGGASSLMAAPAEGVTLEDKQRTIRLMMHAGADIRALNTVRKHLSAVKGGRLAAACRGRTITLAVSDVVGDDLSVIGSGPGVPDATTWADATEELTAWIGRDETSEAVLTLLGRGMAGELPDTPKPGDRSMARVDARVIGSRIDALDGARIAATARGYDVAVLDEAVTGEARLTAGPWMARATARAASLTRPACVLSAGETTVRVSGRGKGGRNQEFALSLAGSIAGLGAPAVAASVGTDGIDGPTDAAGALVDSTTLSRAQEMTIGSPSEFLDANNSYAFFASLDDLIRFGATDTNVGDLQVLLIGVERGAAAASAAFR